MMLQCLSLCCNRPRHRLWCSRLQALNTLMAACRSHMYTKVQRKDHTLQCEISLNRRCPQYRQRVPSLECKIFLGVVLTPWPFLRGEMPGNFHEFKLYTDVMSWRLCYLINPAERVISGRTACTQAKAVQFYFMCYKQQHCPGVLHIRHGQGSDVHYIRGLIPRLLFTHGGKIIPHCTRKMV